MQSNLTFRWLGVAGIEISLNSHTLLVDPFLTRPPFRKVLFGRVAPNEELILKHIQNGDFILITHAHYDHLMDVPVVAHKTGAVVLGSSNSCRLLEICGVPANRLRCVQVGDHFSLNGFQVGVCPARHIRMPVYRPGKLRAALHPPLRLVDYRMDECYSYAIQAGDMRLLIWGGDSANGASRADVLFTNFLSSPAFYRNLLDRVQPSIVIPIHWDNLFRPLSRPLKPSWRPPQLGFPAWLRARPTTFAHAVERFAPASRAFVPEIFQTYVLTNTDQTLQISSPTGEIQ